LASALILTTRSPVFSVHDGQGLAERHAVVGEVGFLSEDRDMPAFEAAGMHCVRKTVGRRAAAGDDDAARSLCA
jgi:hypothetical protein